MTMMCLCVHVCPFFVLFLFGFFRPSWTCHLLYFINFGKLQTIIFKTFILPVLFLFLLKESNCIYMQIHTVFSSWELCSGSSFATLAVQHTYFFLLYISIWILLVHFFSLSGISNSFFTYIQTFAQSTKEFPICDILLFFLFLTFPFDIFIHLHL